MSEAPNAMTEAMRRAGLRTLDDRLARVLTEMLARNAGSMKAAADAALLHIETKEPALAWPLHAAVHHRRAVFARMETIRAEMASAERARRAADAGGAGRAPDGDQTADAHPTTQAPPQGGASRAGQGNPECHVSRACPAPDAPQGASGAGHIAVEDHMWDARPALSRPTAAITGAARAAQAGVAARGLLATIVVNGKPLADALPEEARAAGRAKLHAAKGEVAEARFLLTIAANLPPDDPIGRWRTPEDAEVVMAAAKAWAEKGMSNADE